MIFNPRRGGGEKEYTITAQKPNITLSVTKQKPGHRFQAIAMGEVSKMKFTDPDTGKSVTLQGTLQGALYGYTFVMPAADVTVTY